MVPIRRGLRFLCICLALLAASCARSPYENLVGDYVEIEYRGVQFERTIRGCVTEASAKTLTVESSGDVTIVAAPEIVTVTSQGECEEVRAAIEVAEERRQAEEAAREEAFMAQQAIRAAQEAARKANEENQRQRRLREMEQWTERMRPEAELARARVEMLKTSGDLKAYIVFAEWKADLPSTQVAELVPIVTFLDQHSTASASIGLESGIISDIRSRDLYRARAQAIAEYLATKGIARSNIDIRSPATIIRDESSPFDYSKSLVITVVPSSP